MKKIMLYILVLIFILAGFYIYLWLASLKKHPVDFGISFNPQHAEYLGLDWKEAYIAMLEELKPKYIRIAAMWSSIEEEKNKYDFSNIDWMMDKAQEYNTKITLVVGQKAPRWPECYVPDWARDARDIDEDTYKKVLFDYITTVVERYKNYPALELWQVENEPFIKFRFGECEGFREDLVKKEIDLVHRLDDIHWIMVTDSGELSTWRKARDAGDIFGTTLYRVIRTPGGRVWTYDWLPAASYRFKAKLMGVKLERFYVAELQAEPWFTGGNIEDTSIEIQEETMNIGRLNKHFDYVSRIGTRRAYLWGVEWWYWMKEKQDNSSYWDLVKKKLEIRN